MIEVYLCTKVVEYYEYKETIIGLSTRYKFETRKKQKYKIISLKTVEQKI